MGYAAETTPVDRKRLSVHASGAWTESYSQDEVYYLQNAAFVVEGCLFNVPSRAFEEGSDELKRMINAVIGPDGVQTRLIALTDVSKRDFSRLLHVMYPLDLKPKSFGTLEEWTSVLRLSTQWKLNDVRELAIYKMYFLDIDPIEKIHLSQRFDIAEWQAQACQELVERKTALTAEEAQRIGLETAVQIFQLREATRPHINASGPTFSAFTKSNVIMVLDCAEKEEHGFGTKPSVSTLKDAANNFRMASNAADLALATRNTDVTKLRTTDEVLGAVTAFVQSSLTVAEICKDPDQRRCMVGQAKSTPLERLADQALVDGTSRMQTLQQAYTQDIRSMKEAEQSVTDALVLRDAAWMQLRNVVVSHSSPGFMTRPQ